VLELLVPRGALTGVNVWTDADQVPSNGELLNPRHFFESALIRVQNSFSSGLYWPGGSDNIVTGSLLRLKLVPPE